MTTPDEPSPDLLQHERFPRLNPHDGLPRKSRHRPRVYPKLEHRPTGYRGRQLPETGPVPQLALPSPWRVQVDDALEVYKRMADKGVVVRFRGNEMHCKDCLRITVGTPEQNDTFLRVLQETVASLSAAKDAKPV